MSTLTHHPLARIARLAARALLIATTAGAQAQDTLTIDTRSLPSDVVYELITPTDSLTLVPTDGQLVVPLGSSDEGTFQLEATSATSDNDLVIHFERDSSGIQGVTVAVNDSILALDSAMFMHDGTNSLALFDGPQRSFTPPPAVYHMVLKDGMLITPNGDGDHDVLRVELFVPVTAYTLTVLDKRHREVFRSNDPNETWNGRLNNSGIPLPTGAYQYQLLLNGTTISDHFILQR